MSITPEIPHNTSAAGPDLAPATGSSDDEPALLPVRMLNEFTYCPRLFHLMHVEGRWADNVYTVEGKAVHRRVDAIDHLLPAADAPADPVEESDTTDNGPGPRKKVEAPRRPSTTATTRP